MTKEFIHKAIIAGYTELSEPDTAAVIHKQHHKDIAKLWYVFICILVVFCCVFAAAKQPATIVIHDKVNCSTCAHTTDNNRIIEETVYFTTSEVAKFVQGKRGSLIDKDLLVYQLGDSLLNYVFVNRAIKLWKQ